MHNFYCFLLSCFFLLELNVSGSNTLSVENVFFSNFVQFREEKSLPISNLGTVIRVISTKSKR